MTPERFQEIRRVFEAALDQPLDERAAWLEKACTGDRDLRGEVERLLAVEGRTSELLAAAPTLPQLPPEGRPPWDGTSGQRIGPYQLVRELGRGGMGAVWLAERADQAFRKQVALKLVRAAVGSADMLRRFQQERQILAELDHPHIARVLDGGTTEDGLPYLVMEYVEGEAIDRWCDKHRLDLTERLRLFEQVCAAVAYAHQHLVVHRDLKPSNILVSADGGAKLLDFGIAKMLDGGSGETLSLTLPGLLPMTPEYASPEQVRGEAVTTATDVYALGVVLYELLTGHRPYRLRSRLLNEVARVICEEEPTRPSTAVKDEGETPSGEVTTAERVSALRDSRPQRLRQQLAGDLDNIVLKTLQKQPLLRYQTADQLADDLRRHLAGFPVNARPDKLSYRAIKFVQRNNTGVAAALAGGLLLLGGIAATTWEAQVAREEGQRAEWQSYTANITAADLHLQFGEAAEARRRLKLCSPHLRNWEWRHLFRKADLSLAILYAAPADYWPLHGHNPAFAFSRDGSRVIWNTLHTLPAWNAHTHWTIPEFGRLALRSGESVVALGPYAESVITKEDEKINGDTRDALNKGKRCMLRVSDTASGRVICTLDGHNVNVQTAAFSPDGKHVVTGARDGTVLLWQIPSGKQLAMLHGEESPGLRALAFSPDSESIAAAVGPRAVRLWNTKSGQEKIVLNGHEFPVNAIAFSPDGTKLVTGSNDKTVRIWDLRSGQCLFVLRGHTGIVDSVGFHPDGTKIVSGARDTTVRVWDALSGALVSTLTGHDNGIDSVAFHPDGLRIYSAQVIGGQVRIWDPRDKGGHKLLSGADAPSLSVAFSPDGRRVASGSANAAIRIWNADSTLPLLATSQEDRVSAVAFSPDQAQLASGSGNGNIDVWESTSGRLVKTLVGHSGAIAALTFSSDGQQIISASTDKTVRIWNRLTGQLTRKIEALETITAAAFTSNGSAVALVQRGTPYLDDSVAVWDIASGRTSNTLTFPVDRRRVRIGSVALSPDGSQLIAAESGEPRIWLAELPSGKLLANLPYECAALAFSPDGTRLATGSLDGTVRLWDAKSFEQLLVLRGHQQAVRAVAFSSDGQRIASASMDRSVRVWNTLDPEIGDPIATRKHLPWSLRGLSDVWKAIQREPSYQQWLALLSISLAYFTRDLWKVMALRRKIYRLPKEKRVSAVQQEMAKSDRSWSLNPLRLVFLFGRRPGAKRSVRSEEVVVADWLRTRVRRSFIFFFMALVYLGLMIYPVLPRVSSLLDGQRQRAEWNDASGSGSANDVVGDNMPELGRSDLPDITRISAVADKDDLAIEVKFASGSFDPTQSKISLELDVDENAATGHQYLGASSKPDTGMRGPDYFLLLDPASGSYGARVLRSSTSENSPPALIGLVPILVSTDRVSARVPRSMIGNDDGLVRFKAHVWANVRMEVAFTKASVMAMAIVDTAPDLDLPAARSALH